jgi:molecular chaperone DnaK
MMADAEKYAEEDRQRREEAEVRNRAESLAYTTEKFLAENADKVPDDIKSEVESAIADLKKTLEGTDTEAIKTASEHAAQVSQKMGTAIYAQSQAASAPEGGSAEEPGGQDDDVVEAEIVDDDRPANEEGGAA